ncbi:MAG: pantetheine-phosphate adenylyltransferase [Oligoflexia bacterium]|nr:pantetheine-phosphate adenylyltransferase [Oligoflexia bacterium]
MAGLDHASTTAVYAGSFDPPTFGHLHVIERGTRLFDDIVLAVGTNPAKHYLLGVDERIDVLSRATAHLSGIRVVPFGGLLVDFCRRVGARVILRGLRASTDFDFEFQIGLANMDMAPEIETVFLLTDPKHIFISSSLVKEIAANGGDVSRYVPTVALTAMMRALGPDCVG